MDSVVLNVTRMRGTRKKEDAWQARKQGAFRCKRRKDVQPATTHMRDLNVDMRRPFAPNESAWEEGEAMSEVSITIEMVH